MFTASTALYDLIYARLKDYPAEADLIATLIRDHVPDARRVLDVAAGTGEHARLLAERHGFAVDTLDVDPAFVAIARSKLPGSEVYQADMLSFELPTRYDVVLCLFSAIGYARTLENVARALSCFRHHLRPGGLVLVEPWFEPAVLEAGRVVVVTAEDPAIKVCRMSHLEIDGGISRIRFEYLVGRAAGIERASEVHELGMFTAEELSACLRAAGLIASYDPVGLSGRGLHIGRRA